MLTNEFLEEIATHIDSDVAVNDIDEGTLVPISADDSDATIINDNVEAVDVALTYAVENFETSTFQDNISKLPENTREYFEKSFRSEGWSGIYTYDEETGSHYYYTVGLKDKYNVDELCFINLKPHIAHAFVYMFIEHIILSKENKLENMKIYYGLAMNDYGLATVFVDENIKESMFPIANIMYNSHKNYAMLLIIPQSINHKYPWYWSYSSQNYDTKLYEKLVNMLFRFKHLSFDEVQITI